MVAFAQTQTKTSVSVNANYHNRSCIGGIGLCSEIDTIIESKKSNATVQKSASNEIVFAFDLEQLSKTEVETLNTEKTFMVSGEKNISIDENLLSKLKVDTMFSEIIKGNYPVIVKENKVYVTITLTKK
jgi:ribosomal protein L21